MSWSGFRRSVPSSRFASLARNRELFTDLLEGRFNLVVAMLYDEMPKQGLSKQWLFDDRLVLVMRPDHPLAKRRKVKPSDLLEQKWVFADSDTWSHRRLRLYFEQAGLTVPRARIESRNPAVLKSIIMMQRSHRHDVEAGSGEGALQRAAQMHRDRLAFDAQANRHCSSRKRTDVTRGEILRPHHRGRVQEARLCDQTMSPSKAP